MDLAVAPRREDRLVAIVVADDQQGVIAASADVDDFAGANRHSDRPPVDRDAVPYNS
jgi:hypothetical protein